MSKPLRVLIVEDSEDDAQLVSLALRRGGFEATSVRVETPESMQAALSKDPWDVVLSDYSMPHFSGLAALDDDAKPRYHTGNAAAVVAAGMAVAAVSPERLAQWVGDQIRGGSS